MCDVTFFSATYREARERWVGAVSAHLTTLGPALASHHVLPLFLEKPRPFQENNDGIAEQKEKEVMKGKDGEALSIDIAWFGAS